MFDFFKRNKEYLSCEWLEYGISFSPRGIDHCCMYNPNSNDDGCVSYINKGSYEINDFLNKKRKVLKMHRKGIITPKCKGCYDLVNKKWDKDNKIKYMVLNINYKCNSNCIYCYTHYNKKMFNSIKDVPIISTIKSLLKRNLVSQNCEIHIGGGEPVLNNEFDEILSLFLDNKFKNILIYSSGIQYNSVIERALKEDSCELVISADSGTEELYKKIKNVDKYDDFWKNMKMYCSYQDQNKKESVCLKYIIIPNVNDNKQNIDEFFDKIIEVGCGRVIIDIEREWYKRNQDDEAEIAKLIELMKYMETKISAYNLKYKYFPACIYIMNKYRSTYDSAKVNE